MQSDLVEWQLAVYVSAGDEWRGKLAVALQNAFSPPPGQPIDARIARGLVTRIKNREITLTRRKKSSCIYSTKLKKYMLSVHTYLIDLCHCNGRYIQLCLLPPWSCCFMDCEYLDRLPCLLLIIHNSVRNSLNVFNSIQFSLQTTQGKKVRTLQEGNRGGSLSRMVGRRDAMWPEGIITEYFCNAVHHFFFTMKGFFLIRREVKGQGCCMCTDCKALWGEFGILGYTK